MARPLGCVPDVEFPQLGSGTVGVLVLQTGCRDAEGTGTVHAVVRHCGCGCRELRTTNCGYCAVGRRLMWLRLACNNV